MNQICILPQLAQSISNLVMTPDTTDEIQVTTHSGEIKIEETGLVVPFVVTVSCINEKRLK